MRPESANGNPTLAAHSGRGPRRMLKLRAVCVVSNMVFT